MSFVAEAMRCNPVDSPEPHLKLRVVHQHLEVRAKLESQSTLPQGEFTRADPIKHATFLNKAIDFFEPGIA